MYWRSLVLLLVAFTPWLQAQALDFRPLGAGQGLDAKVITSLLVDRHGLLWVASREGLYRYDGYRVSPVPIGTGGLPDADIRDLYQDSGGYIWVASNTSGLSRYDPRSAAFTHYRYQSADPHTLSHDSVYGMAEDAQGYLWAGSQIGLNRVDPASGRVTRFLHDSADSRSLSHDYVFEVLADAGGTRIWVATVGGGIDLWRQGQGGFEHFDLAALAGGSDELNSVFALARYRAGTLFAGTRHGLVQLDIERGSAYQIDLGGEVPPVISAMAWGPGERLWMATLGRGVLVYDPDSDEITPANALPLGEDGQLPALPQLDLCFSGDRLFVGTWGGGVYMARLQRDDYALVAVGSDPGQLRHHNVTAVLVPDVDTPSGGAESAWLGTFGGGIQALRPGGNRVAPPPGERDPLWSDGVLSIARRRNGQLLAGSNHGLWIMEADGSRRLITAESGLGLGPGYITSLLESDTGDLWVGVGGSGLFRLPAGAEQFESHVHEPEREDSLSGNYITALLQLEDGALLVGTRSSGLNLCRIGPWRCHRFGREQGLAHHNVTTLQRGSGGDIWVGTDGGGLHQLYRHADGSLYLIRRWAQSDGLLGDGIMGIVEDDDGSLWLSSRQGLSRLQPRTGALVHHVAESGLPVTHFNARAAARDRDNLYFGGIGGLVRIPAGTEMLPRPPSPVRLVDLSRVTDGDTIGTQPAMALERVRLDWGEMLSVSFAVLDYAQGQHFYQYRLDDSAPWQPLGPRRELTLLELSPGEHRLSLRGRDVFGSWGQSPALELEVVPPFWMTNWFRSLAMALVLLLAWTLHHYRLRGLRRRNRLLEKLRRQRECALERAETSGRQLAEAHAGLRNLTARLQSAKEDQRQQIARELHDELGQSLTAAKLNLQRVSRAANDEEQSRRLGESVAMLDGMIAQVRGISLSLRPPLLDEAGLVDALKVHLESIADRSDIVIAFHYDGGFGNESEELRTVAFRLVQEAVNNVLRHAGAEKIDVCLQRDEKQLCLSVADNGRGFDPDRVWESVQRGEHLGLLGMLERARSAGGELRFDAQPGQGSKIRAVIPL